MLSQGGIDLVILDIMMPFMDGMTCLREMRTRKIMTPVIMLTARSEEYDKLTGWRAAPMTMSSSVLPAGAGRPCQGRAGPHDAKARRGHRELYLRRFVHRHGQPQRKGGRAGASLTPKEFDLLVFLVSNKGIALSREKILQKVWNYDYYGEDRTVDTHVKMLRGHLGACRKMIVTVWGIGYKFDPDAV